MKKRTRISSSSPAIRFSCLSLLAGALLLPTGTAWAGTTLRQTIMAELRYDSNASIAAEGQPGGDDFAFVLTPGFEAVNQRGKLTLTGLYRPTNYFYFQNQDLNTLSHSGMVEAGYELSSRTTAMVQERVTYTKESLETTLTGIQNERGYIFTNTVNLSMSHQLTQKAAVALAASDYKLDFSDPAAMDSRNDSGDVSLTYQATPETQISGSYNFSYASFEQNDVTSSQKTHSLSAGFNTRFRDTLLLLMNAGAVYAMAPGEDGGFFDWVARAEVRKTIRRFEANASYTRRTTTSSGVTDQLTLNESYSAGLRRDLTRNVSLSVSGNFTKNHSKPDARLDTKSYTAGASASWRLYEWLSLSTGYSFFKQEADGPLGEDIEREHVFMNLNMTTFEKRF